MKSIIRLGDTSDHGGLMVTATAHFKANDTKGCITGDLHRCPIHGHGVTSVTGHSTVTSNGVSILLQGDVAGCGAVLNAGSGNVVSD